MDIRNRCLSILLAIVVATSLLISSVWAFHTDGDGLLDLIDAPGFDPSASDQVKFNLQGIQDLDGANLLTNLQVLGLIGNQITSIQSDGFRGLTNLKLLILSDNQIASIKNGAFEEFNNLETLLLVDNPITEANFTGANFANLRPCSYSTERDGFCFNREKISSLVLDDATLSQGSFYAIVDDTCHIRDVSLVGLTFSDENPAKLSRLLASCWLENVTVDQALFDLYADEFNAFAATDGNTLTVVPGLCDVNRDSTCDVVDIDAMTQMVRKGTATSDQLTGLITRSFPAGFHTYFGDANLDGEFNSTDLVAVLAAGEYEDGIESNSGWSEGDFDGDGEFTSSDLITALADGGYEQGPPQAVFVAVPEPVNTMIFPMGVLVLSRWRNRKTS